MNGEDPVYFNNNKYYKYQDHFYTIENGRKVKNLAAYDYEAYPKYYSYSNEYGNAFLKSCGEAGKKVRHGFVCEWGDRMDIAGAEIVLGQTEYTYNGSACKPSVKVVYQNRHTLESGYDYEVTYSNNVYIGKATVTVTGKGRFTGTAVKTFDIFSNVGFTASDVTLSKTAYSYNGTARKPAVTVKVDGKKLKKGVDYTVTYSGESGIGTAYVYVTGIGNYHASVTVPYQITLSTPKKLTGKSEATGEASLSWNKVSKADGYDVRYYKKKSTVRNTDTFTKKTAVIKGLSGGETYAFQVRAYKKINGTTFYSGWSSGINLPIADEFVYIKGKYYYRGAKLSQKTYDLSGPLIVEEALELPAKTKITAKSISIRAATKLGKSAALMSLGDFEVKSKGSLSMEKNAEIGVNEDFVFNPSSSAKTTSLENGKITVTGNVTIKKKFKSLENNVIELIGDSAKKISCGKGCSIACLYLKSVTLDKLKLSGKGKLDVIKFHYNMPDTNDDIRKQFSFSAPKTGEKRDANIEKAISDVLFTIMYSNAYIGKDLLKDFYGTFKGVAIYNTREFSVPVVVQKGEKLEYGVVSGKMNGLNKLDMGIITYKSGGKTYQTVCTPTLDSTKSAVKSFMKKMRKSAAEEIKEQAQDVIITQFLASLKEVAEEFSWEKGMVWYKRGKGQETLEDFAEELGRYMAVHESIEKKGK